MIGPALPEKVEKVWCLWVCRGFSDGGDQTWDSYVLPGTPKECFKEWLLPSVEEHPYDNSYFDTNTNRPIDSRTYKHYKYKTILTLEFKDVSGATVLEEHREITTDKSQNRFSRSPLVRLLIYRDLKGSEVFENINATFDTASKYDEKKHVYNGYLAPFVLHFTTGSRKREKHGDLLPNVSSRSE